MQQVVKYSGKKKEEKKNVHFCPKYSDLDKQVSEAVCFVFLPWTPISSFGTGPLYNNKAIERRFKTPNNHSIPWSVDCQKSLCGPLKLRIIILKHLHMVHLRNSNTRPRNMATALGFVLSASDWPIMYSL